MIYTSRATPTKQRCRLQWNFVLSMFLMASNADSNDIIPWIPKPKRCEQATRSSATDGFLGLCVSEQPRQYAASQRPPKSTCIWRGYRLLCYCKHRQHCSPHLFLHTCPKGQIAPDLGYLRFAMCGTYDRSIGSEALVLVAWSLYVSVTPLMSLRTWVSHRRPSLPVVSQRLQRKTREAYTV